MRSVATALGLVVGAALPGAPLPVSAGSETSLAADLASSPLWLGFLGGGLVAMAAVAMLGGAWHLARRRRRAAHDARRVNRPEARLVRRRRLPEADDPIMASMGLGRAADDESEHAAVPATRGTPTSRHRSRV
jgi:hypothetical protein